MNKTDTFIITLLWVLFGLYIIGGVTTYILSVKYVPGVSIVSCEDRAMMHAIGWPLGLPMVIRRIGEP